MNFPRSMTCCFTGHRVIPESERGLVWDAALANIQALYARGYRTFIAGGAIGFDMLAAQAVCELKLEHPDVRLVLALPFRGHSVSWSAGDRSQLAELEAFADEVTELRDSYSAGVYAARNRWMVEHSSACVCYLRQSGHSGTAQTVEMARKSGLRLIRV